MDKSLIREAIKSLIHEVLFDASLSCTVTAVDESSKTITAKSVKEDLEYFNVKLIASNTSGVYAIPVVGSVVSISFLDGVDTMAFVSQLGEIEKYIIENESGIKLELMTDKLLINGDNLEGLVRVRELVEKLNALEERMNTHQHLIPGTNSPTLPDVATNPIIPPTQKVELENEKVKHGS